MTRQKFKATKAQGLFSRTLWSLFKARLNDIGAQSLCFCYSLFLFEVHLDSCHQHPAPPSSNWCGKKSLPTYLGTLGNCFTRKTCSVPSCCFFYSQNDGQWWHLTATSNTLCHTEGLAFSTGSLSGQKALIYGQETLSHSSIPSHMVSHFGIMVIDYKSSFVPGKQER